MLISKTSFILILAFSTIIGFSQPTTLIITGKIKNENNSEIPYVNIWLKNQNNIGTSSNLQGKFVIPLSESSINDTLVFSYIGYLNYYLPVANVKTQSELQITLKKNIKTFDEITVNAKRSDLKNIINRFNKQRVKHIPKNTTKFEVFVRQFIKIDNSYYSLLESFFSISSENQKTTCGELLYLNKIENNAKDKYLNNCFFPSIDFMVFLDYPEISKKRKYKYSLDTVVPFCDDGFIYVISEKYTGKSSFYTHVESTVKGDIIIEESIQDSSAISKTEHYVTNKYYITNDYKLNKVVYETYFKNARILEIIQNNHTYYRQILCYIFEIEYKDVNGKIYPFRMNTVYGYKYFDKNNNNYLTKSIVTQYHVGKIEQNTIINEKLNKNNFQNLDFYDTSPIIVNKKYENIIIKDDLREIVIEELKK